LREKGNAEPGHLALLEDGVAIVQGRKQTNGSQIGTESQTHIYYNLQLEDPENVDLRRAQVGLPPLSGYIEEWQIKWDVEQYKKDLPSIESNLKRR